MKNESLMTIAKIAIEDPPVSWSEKQRLISLLGLDGPEPERVISRKEAARRLGVNLWTIDSYHRRGILLKRCEPGKTKARGFLLSDVQTLITNRRRG